MPKIEIANLKINEICDDTLIAETIRAQIELLHRNLRHADESGLQFQLRNINDLGKPSFPYQEALRLWREF